MPGDPLSGLRLDLDLEPTDGHGHLSDFDLDCFVAGASSPEAAARVEAHAAGCAECAARLAAFQVDPPELNDARVLAGVRRALDAPEPGLGAWLQRTRLLWAGLALGGAAAAVAVYATRVEPAPSPQPVGVRMKGSLRLHVLRQVGQGAEPVAAGEAITPDDRLRFQVTLPERARVAVVGVEPTGDLYPAWPLAEHDAEPVVAAGVRRPLPGAVSLDGPRGVEHLYLVACPADADAPTCTSNGADRPPTCPEACRTSAFRFVRP